MEAEVVEDDPILTFRPDVLLRGSSRYERRKFLSNKTKQSNLKKKKKKCFSSTI